MKILVTGTAGFIGFHLANRLVQRGDEVIGIDSINDYYDVNLKYARLKEAGIATDKIEYGYRMVSKTHPNYSFIQLNLEDKEGLRHLFERFKPQRVCNLAAQAGVRYSMENPSAYVQSNLVGFLNILEACRANRVEHLVYASSSSVYGLNQTMPFSTSHNVDHPISLYAASKKSNELMAHTYSHLFNLPTTGLRFFTVYGPWGRPDMALFIFTKAILEGKPIEVFNGGDMQRDFTYIDDIVEGVVRVLDDPPKGDPEWSGKNPNPATAPSPYRLYNIGNSSPVKLMDFVRTIEEELGTNAQIEYRPLQAGDVPATWADVEDLWEKQNFRPQTPIKEGIGKFIAWYKKFYAIEN